MAKKKVVSSATRKPASGSKGKPRSKINRRRSSDAKKPAVRKPVPEKQDIAVAAPLRQRVLSEQQIGKVAGEIWHVLAEQGGQSMTALKKSIDAPTELVLAALGWLAREGKLDFATSGQAVKVSLR